MSSALPSRAVAERALHLPVRREADDLWIVASGSDPGKTYVVADNDGVFLCSCVGVIGCSHAYAARAHADPAVRRQLRALVRVPRRMGREAATRLLERYWTARRGDVDDFRSPAHEARAREKLQRATADIVARLTGHADAEAGDE